MELLVIIFWSFAKQWFLISLAIVVMDSVTATLRTRQAIFHCWWHQLHVWSAKALLKGGDPPKIILEYDPLNCTKSDASYQQVCYYFHHFFSQKFRKRLLFSNIWMFRHHHWKLWTIPISIDVKALYSSPFLIVITLVFKINEIFCEYVPFWSSFYGSKTIVDHRI